MRIILDTGALFHPEVLRRTLGLGEVVLPAVAYAERLRQIVAAGRKPEELARVLRRALIDVEPFGRAQADRIPGLADSEWRRLARDAMIAAHLQPGDRLWTTNPKDFLALGMPKEQIVAVP
jgi:predicted nucleic acid-binding protein